MLTTPFKFPPASIPVTQKALLKIVGIVPLSILSSALRLFVYLAVSETLNSVPPSEISAAIE